MEIKTKFAIGDKVWTAHKCRAKQIDVSAIVVDEGGVWYRNREDYVPFHESECFASKEDLIEHIAAD